MWAATGCPTGAAPTSRAQRAAVRRLEFATQAIWMSKIGFAVLIVTGTFVGGCGNGRPDWISLRTPLGPANQTGFSASFTAKNDGIHDISLEFSWPIEDPQVAAFVDRAAATAGSSSAPELDVSWQLQNDSREVARGDGKQRVTGYMETSLNGLGGGPLKSRALVFGTCSLRAGSRYTLRLSPGTGFDAVLRVSPTIQVERRAL